MRKGTCLLFLFFLGVRSFLFAQIDGDRAVIARMQKGKWSAAEQRLKKILQKDSQNVQATFLYARFYFSPSNPAYHIDSAYQFTMRSSRILMVSSPRQKDRLKKLSIDSSTFVTLREKIDSTAFERAKQLNTEGAYNSFIDNFVFSPQIQIATELRDEVAFVEALKMNTAESFKTYTTRFPASLRAQEASDRFEKLLFEEKTRDRTLEVYRMFLSAFPQSAYRREVEQRIFEISTASGLSSDYINFIAAYPESFLSGKATNILYYVWRETNPALPFPIATDSLRALDQLNKGYWVPFFRNGLYGFMNDEGNEVMGPIFEKIDSAYLCGNIREDFLLTSAGLFSRTGVKLLEDTPQQAFHLGFGFLRVSRKVCSTVVHKLGFQIGPACTEDAKVIADQFLAIKENGKWGMYAFNGLRLLPANYEDVAFVDKVVLLTRSGKKILVRSIEISALADRQTLDESRVFDEVRSWGEGNLLVKNGSLEGVVNQMLEFVIPLDRQTLTKTSFGFIRSKGGQLKIVGVIPELEEESFDAVKDYGDWLGLRQVSQLLLYSVSSRKIIAGKLDSLWIRNRIAFGIRNDSLFVFGRSTTLASFGENSPITFITGSDTLVYFWVPEKKSRTVFEANKGKRIFTHEFDEMESIGRGLFIFSRSNKKGIITIRGKVILPAEYDAIIPASNGFLSLLKEKKFGLYDVVRGKLIKSEYERNILPYSNKYFIAFKGAYGIISATEEPVTAFEFEEIRHWNDTAAWVRKNFSWSIYAIKERTVKIGRIKNYQEVRRDDQEKIVRIQAENYFGVISNRKGVIIPPTFTDVINIGSDEKPFYFTEKRVEEADIYVVIYYDARGKFIRKQVYETAEYEQIYCEAN